MSMKRLLVSLLIASLIIGCISCGGEESTTDENTATPTTMLNLKADLVMDCDWPGILIWGSSGDNGASWPYLLTISDRNMGSIGFDYVEETYDFSDTQGQVKSRIIDEDYFADESNWYRMRRGEGMIELEGIYEISPMPAEAFILRVIWYGTDSGRWFAVCSR